MGVCEDDLREEFEMCGKMPFQLQSQHEYFYCTVMVL